MRSRASIAGHPLHAMLIVVPAGGFILTLVFDIVYLATGSELWWAATRPVLPAAVIGALVAAIPGAIDLFTVVPKGRATTTGLTHMVLARDVDEATIREHVRISADPAQHVAWLREDFALGASEVYVHQVVRNQPEWIALCAAEILPRV